MSSCEGRKTGAFCDPILEECRCSEDMTSCPNPSRGNICDLTKKACTCSASALVCDRNEYCTMGSCIGNVLAQWIHENNIYQWIRIIA